MGVGSGVDVAELRLRRLRAHRLSARAASLADAASQLLAVQSQDFRGGRWALAVRTQGAPTLDDVDAAFDRGDLVRSWTMRGTVHTVPARDLAWMLEATAQRQQRSAASVHRREGLADDDITNAERVVCAALRGGGRLSRADLFALLDRAGVSTAGQRGYHLLRALAMRGVVCLGPVIPHDRSTHEQYIVRVDEWVADASAVADPLGELLVRYLTGHGPAGLRDAAWWTGLPVTVLRAAADAHSGRLQVVGDLAGEPLYATADQDPPAASAPAVVALPPFDEHYLSYGDRSVAASESARERIGPGKNGMVSPVLVAAGAVIGTWKPALAGQGRSWDAAVELFGEHVASGVVDGSAVDAALDRFARFLTG